MKIIRTISSGYQCTDLKEFIGQVKWVRVLIGREVSNWMNQPPSHSWLSKGWDLRVLGQTVTVSQTQTDRQRPRQSARFSVGCIGGLPHRAPTWESGWQVDFESLWWLFRNTLSPILVRDDIAITYVKDELSRTERKVVGSEIDACLCIQRRNKIQFIQKRSGHCHLCMSCNFLLTAWVPLRIWRCSWEPTNNHQQTTRRRSSQTCLDKYV